SLASQPVLASSVRSDSSRSAAQIWFVHRVTRDSVVVSRSAHAFDRLLRSVHSFGVLVTARYRPQRRLLAVAGPVAFLAHGVPARLVLPVIIAPPDDKALLGPDDLCPNLKALPFQTGGHSAGVQSAMPDICDIAAK